jgi:hypothetical protein
MSWIHRLLGTLAFVLGSGLHAQPAPAVPVAAELLDFAAADFRQHMQPLPTAFRHVRLGELKSADGSQRRSVLCGEFRQPGPGATWAPFATIKTSPYEHWVGGSAEGYCKAPLFKAQGADLSQALTDRVVAR